MNKIVSIAVLALIVIGIFLAFDYYSKNYAGGESQSFTDLNGVDSNNFLTYRHPSGFEIAYPYSFLAQTYDDPRTLLKVVFSGGSGGYGEAMEMAVLDQKPEALKSQSIAELSAEEKKTVVEGKAFNAQIVSFTTKSGEQSYYQRTAIFTCGNATVIFAASVPVELKKDLNQVNYMISTFKCGTLGS